MDHSPHFACGRPRYWRRERDGPLLPICGPSGVSGAESTFLARQRIPTKCHPVGSAVGGERGIPSGSVRCGETWGSPCRTTSEYINGDPRTGLVGTGPCLLLVLLHPPSRETNKPEKLTPCGPLLHSLPRWRAPSMVPLSPPRTLMDVTPSRLLASRPRWVFSQTVVAREWRANIRRNSSFPTAPA